MEAGPGGSIVCECDPLGLGKSSAAALIGRALHRWVSCLPADGVHPGRTEELELATPERRLMVAEAITAAVEEFSARRRQAITQPQKRLAQRCKIVMAPPFPQGTPGL